MLKFWNHCNIIDFWETCQKFIQFILVIIVSDLVETSFKGILKSHVHLDFIQEYLHERAWPNDLTLTYHFQISDNMYLGVHCFLTNFLEFVYLYTVSMDLMWLQMHCSQPKPWCFLGQPQGVALKLVMMINYRIWFCLVFLSWYKCFSSSVTCYFLNLEAPMHSFCTLIVSYPS